MLLVLALHWLLLWLLGLLPLLIITTRQIAVVLQELYLSNNMMLGKYFRGFASVIGVVLH